MAENVIATFFTRAENERKNMSINSRMGKSVVVQSHDRIPYGKANE